MATTVLDSQGSADTARWVACEQCGHLDHPGLTCEQADELVRAAALRELLGRIGPILLAALDEAADERLERVEGSCVDCAWSGEERCEDHREDLARAAEYRRTHDALSAALEV